MSAVRSLALALLVLAFHRRQPSCVKPQDRWSGAHHQSSARLSCERWVLRDKIASRTAVLGIDCTGSEAGTGALGAKIWHLFDGAGFPLARKS